MITIVDALIVLTPNAEYTTNGDEIVWLDEEQDQPTQEEIVQKIAELEYTEEVEVYKEVRAKAYPVMSEQLDKIFHQGIDAWKADIQAIKDAHPKAVIDTDTLEARKSQALSDYQLKKYTEAQTRLAQYIVADGRAEETKMQDGPNQLTDSDGMPQFDSDGSPIYEQVEVITVTAIDPVAATITETQYDSDMTATEVEVANPLITKDSEERATAQAIVDSTPQPVIDEYNS